MSQQNVEKPPSKLLVMGTILFYLVAALTMVIANKKVLSETSAPLFFLFAQLLIAVVLFLLCHILGIFPVPFVFDRKTCKGLAPMICINVLGLSFNNYTLKYVDASFYQVARGLVLPITVLLSYLFLAARPSLRVLLSCALVTLGFFIGVLLDTASTAPTTSPPRNTLGIMFGVFSSLTTATSAVVIKRSLAVVSGSTLHLSWYNNVLSAGVLLPVVFLAGEGSAVADLLFAADPALAENQRTWSTFLWGSLVTGVFGFMINIAGFLSIKVTSPISHMVSSAVRGVVVSVLGVWLFNEIITTGRAASILVIVVGSIYYTYVKNAESERRPQYERVPLEKIEQGSGGKTARD